MAFPPQVIFDVGNVLLRWDPQALICREVADASLHPRILCDVFGHEDWKHLDHGTLEEEAAVLRFQERVGLSLEHVRRLVQASKECLEPMPESLALLEELAAHRVRLYCLTNMSHGTWAYLKGRYDFWRRFEGIVVSAEVRLIKPDPAIYRHLLERHALVAQETAFLDDNEANVRAARSVGLRARVFGPDARAWLWEGAPPED